MATRALSQLRSAYLLPIEAVLTTLINEIDALDRDFTLILDDYHVIDAASIHGSLTFLLDCLPRHMHLIIASRADPLLAPPQ